MTEREIALLRVMSSPGFLGTSDLLAKARMLMSGLREEGFVLCPTVEHETQALTREP